MAEIKVSNRFSLKKKRNKNMTRNGDFLRRSKFGKTYFDRIFCQFCEKCG